MPTITRFLEWDAGHRLINHEGKCSSLHGHRYKAGITIKTPRLDKIGRAVDFGVVKQVVGTWIDEHWDHTMILNSEDPLLKMCSIMDAKEKQLAGKVGSYSKAVFGPRKPYLIRNQNPTAEVIGEHLFTICQELLNGILSNVGGQVFKVRVWETPNCHSDVYERDLHHETT